VKYVQGQPVPGDDTLPVRNEAPEAAADESRTIPQQRERAHVGDRDGAHVPESDL